VVDLLIWYSCLISYSCVCLGIVIVLPVSDATLRLKGNIDRLYYKLTRSAGTILASRLNGSMQCFYWAEMGTACIKKGLVRHIDFTGIKKYGRMLFLHTIQFKFYINQCKVFYLINSFNKTEAAIIPMQGMYSEGGFK